jgi:hypothetical protein
MTTNEAVNIISFFDLKKAVDSSCYSVDWPDYLVIVRRPFWKDNGHLDDSSWDLLSSLYDQIKSGENLGSWLSSEPAQILMHDQAKGESKSGRRLAEVWRRRLLSLNNYLAYSNEHLLKIAKPTLLENDDTELAQWVMDLGIYPVDADEEKAMLSETDEAELEWLDDAEWEFEEELENQREIWRDYAQVHGRAGNVATIFLFLEKFSIEALQFATDQSNALIEFNPRPRRSLVDERLRALREDFGITFNYTAEVAETLFALRKARNLYMHGRWDEFDTVLAGRKSSDLIYVCSQLIHTVCFAITKRFAAHS